MSETNTAKALNISTVTAQVAIDSLKTLVILSYSTVRRSAVKWENLKPYRKSEKKGHISRSDQQVYYLQYFHKMLLTTAQTED